MVQLHISYLYLFELWSLGVGDSHTKLSKFVFISRTREVLWVQNRCFERARFMGASTYIYDGILPVLFSLRFSCVDRTVPPQVLYMVHQKYLEESDGVQTCNHRCGAWQLRWQARTAYVLYIWLRVLVCRQKPGKTQLRETSPPCCCCVGLVR